MNTVKIGKQYGLSTSSRITGGLVLHVIPGARPNWNVQFLHLNSPEPRNEMEDQFILLRKRQFRVPRSVWTPQAEPLPTEYHQICPMPLPWSLETSNH